MNYNGVITPSDIGENEEKKFYIDMVDFFSENYEEILKYFKPIFIGGKEVTILDLFNVPYEEDEEIINFIYERLQIDVESKKGLQEINKLFEESISFYERRYLRKLPKKYIKGDKNFFNSAKSVINFIKGTKKNRKFGALNCAILKTSYVVWDLLSNERFLRENFLNEEFAKNYVDFYFQIEDGYTDEDGKIHRSGKVVIDGRIINFKFVSRQKGKDSLIGKQIAFPCIYSINQIYDLVGGTFYVENDTQATLILQFISQAIYKSEGEIRSKNGINIDNLETVNLKDDFLEKFLEAIINSYRKETSTGDYKDIKTLGIVDLKFEKGKRTVTFPTGAEIKIIIGEDKNDYGLSFQPIYDYLKRPRELTRLGLPIFKTDLVNYVNDFFGNIDKNLSYKNKEKNTYYAELLDDLQKQNFVDPDIILTWELKENEKILAKGLYKYFLSKLVKVRIGKSRRDCYFNKNILDLSNVGLYKNVKIMD